MLFCIVLLLCTLLKWITWSFCSNFVRKAKNFVSQGKTRNFVSQNWIESRQNNVRMTANETHQRLFNEWQKATTESKRYVFKDPTTSKPYHDTLNRKCFPERIFYHFRRRIVRFATEEKNDCHLYTNRTDVLVSLCIHIGWHLFTNIQLFPFSWKIFCSHSPWILSLNLKTYIDVYSFCHAT